MRSPNARGWVLAVMLGLTFAAATLGAFFRPGEWYSALVKPPLTPPNFIFGPVWTVLYLAIAVAAWLVWDSGADGERPGRTPARHVRLALLLYFAQLALNAAWSGVFFGLQRADLALVEIVVLLGLAVATLAAFARCSRVAAWLFLPYVGWLAFATYLNAGIWWLNR